MVKTQKVKLTTKKAVAFYNAIAETIPKLDGAFRESGARFTSESKPVLGPFPDVPRQFSRAMFWNKSKLEDSIKCFSELQEDFNKRRREIQLSLAKLDQDGNPIIIKDTPIISDHVAFEKAVDEAYRPLKDELDVELDVELRMVAFDDIPDAYMPVCDAIMPMVEDF